MKKETGSMAIMKNTGKKDIRILSGDFIEKIGSEGTDVMGKYGLGEQNERVRDSWNSVLNTNSQLPTHFSNIMQ